MNDKPVAWGIVASNTGKICQVELDAQEVAQHNQKYIVPLYTNPAKEWVGLTNDERDQLAYSVAYDDYHILVDNVEAKLKEKNGYGK